MLTATPSPVPFGALVLWLLIFVGIVGSSAIVSALDFETESQFASEQAADVAIVRVAQSVVAEVR